ncbi:MAG TPA: pyridoxal-dependent decarboxylase [Candidatus Limnocylindrales bacterium]|nr:pyridoxal-dependent decarboxylase [Candidatus Limnocylindrales bacterium]
MDDLLRRAAELGTAYLASVDTREVAPAIAPDDLRARLGGPVPEGGSEPEAVLSWLAEAVEPGIVASAGPRYFGFVMGGSQPVAVAADWLTSAWDQNAGLYVRSPAAAVAEEIAGQWLVELLGLPTGVSVGFTSGGTMANFTALAAARHAVFRDAGWDVEARGLLGAPEVHVLAGEESHATAYGSLQLLGLGRDAAARIPADGQGRMRADALAAALSARTGPTIVSAQAGNVNTGSFDPLPEIAAAVAAHRARGNPTWLHVDGAIGLWAAAVPSLRHLTRGLELADSWTTDAHKWLNVPYDSGLVFVRDVEAHRAAMSFGSHGVEHVEGGRDSYDFVPESSRRARGFVVLAALRTLGREGLADLIERCCALARRMAERLAADPAIEILNDVVLNQVLVRFAPPGGQGSDAFTAEVIRRVQASGTLWLGGRTWHGQGVMRVSMTSWNTTEADVDRSAAVILACRDAAVAAWPGER